VIQRLPDGFTIGHWTDVDRWTGCSVILPPPGGVAAGEVRGGAAGTRELDLLSPSAALQRVDAVLLTGGSAFGLGAADGVIRLLAERSIGFRTTAAVVPLVSSAVVYDLGLGESSAFPGPAEAYAAAEAAVPTTPRGSVGAGTGCTVGKLLGTDGWTKGGLGTASLEADGATVAAVAVVNAFGEVRGEDGSVLAGVWRDGSFVPTIELLQSGARVRRPAREATTLVCVLTDAALSKIDAWHVARAASGGVARAVVPSATTVDGDATFVLASGVVGADPFTVSAVAAEAAAHAIRDAVEAATGAPGCPSASDRSRL
jgi:L-aminopeptidase/D-esterase-like protein